MTAADAGQRVTLVDYGVGNIASITNMFRKVGAQVDLTDSAEAVRAAERLVLPGVGAFDSCAAALRARPGLADAIRERSEQGTPLLGICVGMQLLMSSSEEGHERGLALIGGTARRFDFQQDNAAALRIPHMSWAVIDPAPGARLFPQSQSHRRFYFVHSYHVVCDDRADVAAWATYGYPFAASVERGNIFGVQFHPEKSHSFGMQLFRRFLEI
jgi:glutamine amidotransferase